MAREPSMEDRREYIRVSVTLPMNPKLGMIDDPAVSWLYVVSLCHCGEYLTDGVFILGLVARAAGVPSEVGKRLVSTGMWHEPGHECPRCPQPDEGHLIVHDYLRHQRSRTQAEQVREVRRAAANSRWSKRTASRMQNASDVQCTEDAPSTGDAPPAQPPEHDLGPSDATSMQDASTLQCKTDAEVEVEVEKYVGNSPSVGGSGGDASQQAAPPKRARNDQGARITEDWTPSPAKRASLMDRVDRPTQWWLDETAAFINHFISQPGQKGRKTNWDATFDNWVREAVRREGRHAPSSMANGNGKRHQSEGYLNGVALARRLHEEEQAQLALEGNRK